MQNAKGKKEAPAKNAPKGSQRTPVPRASNAPPNLPPRRQKAHTVPQSSVPSLDAFKSIPPRRPPNLPGQPGYVEDIPQKEPPRSSALLPGQAESAKPKKQKKAADDKKRKERAEQTISPAQKRRRRYLGSMALFTVFILLCLTFLSVTMLKIEKFELEGESPYTLEEIVGAFGHEEGENLLFSFDSQKEQRRMQEKLPYLESVTIHRRPLSTIVFRVSTALPRYSVALDGQYALLSESRKVLEIAETPPEGLITIEGAVDTTASPGHLFVVADILVQDGMDVLLEALKTRNELENVTLINVADPLRMYFVWKDRFTVVVGTKSNISAKLDYVMVLLTDSTQTKFTEADYGTLDVSGYPAVPNAIYSPGR